MMNKISIPDNYDYVGVYLTDKCHLACPYCITRHHGAEFVKGRALSLPEKRMQKTFESLTPQQWIEGLNRLELPKDVPVSLQGGEPFLYKGIWEILEGVRHKVDIMTALPNNVTVRQFNNLKSLEWNKRPAPYPTIRVSYHKGQNNYKELIERIAELQEVVNIGLYYLDHPGMCEEIEALKAYARRYAVELRSKEFLGEYEGKHYGTFLYPEAVRGTRVGIDVMCKNTVVPIAPDGTIYRCHSDLYFHRHELALGNILTSNFQLPTSHIPCRNYGLCSECDVKVKTNHYQVYGYTSVDIKFQTKEVKA